MATLQSLNFAPTSISGCLLWLDAADPLTVVQTANSVTQWNDKSGNNNTMTTQNGSPVYSPSLLNGRPGMDLTNSSGFISVGTPSLSASLTVAMILVVKSGIANWGSFFMHGGRNNDISFERNSISTGTTLQFQTADDNVGANITFTTDQVALYLGTLTSGTSRFFERFGGGTSTTTTATNSSTISPGSKTIRIGRSDAGEACNSFIGEVLYYNNVLTTAQRQQVEGYLAWKWGLQASLPSDHPFRLIAPNSAGLSYPSALQVPAPLQSFQVSTTPLVLFNPNSLPACFFWLNAADLPSLTTSGSTVTSWRDRSASGLVLNTARNTLPVLGAGLNGLNTVLFGSNTGITQVTRLDGVKNFFWVGTRTINQDLPFLMGDDSFFDWHADTLNFIGGSAAAGLQSASPAILYTNNTNTSNSFINITIPVLGNPFLLSVRGITGSTRFQGICYDRSATARGYRGDVGEVICYSNALTTAQHQQVEGYLAWKWGLQTSLPSSHPFRFAVPGPGPVSIPVSITSFQSASFRPTSISGLQIWLDGADPLGTGALVSNGATISTWTDKSGNGRNATSLEGTLTASANSLVFTGSQAMTTSLGSAMTSQSIFITASVNTSTYVDLISTDSGSSNTVLNGLQIIMSNYTQQVTRLGGALFVSGGTTTQNTRVLYEVVYSSGGSSFLYLNGSQTGVNLSSPTISGSGTVMVGAYRNNSIIGEYFIGNMNEILIYNTILTTAQRQTIEGYLAWKWGLQGTLPGTHPFRNVPPPP
jgi:hypothetical protein